MTPSQAPDSVLVVDDDPDSRALLHAALLSAGITPLLAADGERAIALLADVSPDLILLDAVMPPPDGFETCRRIKAQPAIAHIPVIFMTGLSETEHVVAGLSAGAVDYVAKPIILDELLARIRVHLANARLAHSARAALDATGRRLIATDAEGALRWSTPQGNVLLGELALAPPGFGPRVARLIAELPTDIERGERPALKLGIAGREIEICYVGRGDGEYFFRISEVIAGMEAAILQRALGLTPRESDVLLWIANGKSNRDTSEILNISARTVNKHLEQIFIKLGVENRAAAASIATRIIAMHG